MYVPWNQALSWDKTHKNHTVLKNVRGATVRISENSTRSIPLPVLPGDEPVHSGEKIVALKESWVCWTCESGIEVVREVK